MSARPIDSGPIRAQPWRSTIPTALNIIKDVSEDEWEVVAMRRDNKSAKGKAKTLIGKSGGRPIRIASRTRASADSAAPKSSNQALYDEYFVRMFDAAFSSSFDSLSCKGSTRKASLGRKQCSLVLVRDEVQVQPPRDGLWVVVKSGTSAPLQLGPSQWQAAEADWADRLQPASTRRLLLWWLRTIRLLRRLQH